MKNELSKRIKKIKFGEPITNVCTTEQNPQHHCYFVRYNPKHKTVECTNKEGKFWQIYAETIYPSHLSQEDCDIIWKEIWKDKFGKYSKSNLEQETPRECQNV